MSRGPHIDHPYWFEWNGEDHSREFEILICEDEASSKISEDLEVFFKGEGLSGKELENALKLAMDTVVF